MKKTFAFDGSEYDIESVYSSVEYEEPSQFIQFTATTGELVGYVFIIGEFEVEKGDEASNDDDDGNKLKFSVSFLNKSAEENKVLFNKYHETFRSIVTEILEDIVSDLKDKELPLTVE